MLGHRTSVALLAAFLLGIQAFLSVPLRAAPPTDEAGFTEYVIAKLSVELPSAKFTTRQPLFIEILFDDGGASQASLDRVWRYCAANATSDCERAIGYVVAGITPPPRGRLAVDRSMVRAVVRTADTLASYEISLRTPLVTAPFAGDLRIACIIDRPTNLSYMTEVDLKDLGLTRAGAIALGIQNVAANLKPLQDVLMGDPADAWGHSDGDDYESGRILLHSGLAELSGAWGDRLIVAVPGTHTVLYADGRRADAIPAMRKAVREEMGHAERSISATLFLWTQTGWEVIPPQRLTIPPARSGGSTER
jgi:hypothetical protein